MYHYTCGKAAVRCNDLYDINTLFGRHYTLALSVQGAGAAQSAIYAVIIEPCVGRGAVDIDSAAVGIYIQAVGHGKFFCRRLRGAHLYNVRLIEQRFAAVSLYTVTVLLLFGQPRYLVLQYITYMAGITIDKFQRCVAALLDDYMLQIYASAFMYDEYGVPEWPAQTINYTNKTQFLFRIEKGCLNINDHEGVNEYIPPENIRVPLRNIVYFGDSDTDIPCMKLVNSYGGHSIGVYDKASGNKEKVYRLINNDRIRYFAPADYTEGSEIDCLVKAIINKTAAYEKLESKHVHDLLETRKIFKN